MGTIGWDGTGQAVAAQGVHLPADQTADLSRQGNGNRERVIHAEPAVLEREF